MSTAKQANIRTIALILTIVGSVGAFLYNSGGDAAVLESRVSAGETWRGEHETMERDAAKETVERGKLLAVFVEKFKTVIEKLDAIKIELRRLANAKDGP